MAQKKKKITFIIIIVVFIVYFLTAARPVPREMILAPGWISSIGTERISGNHTGLLPFTLGSNYGYVDSSGEFAVNKVKENDIYLSRNMWTEYDAEPDNIIINNIYTGLEIKIENAGGYPLLLDNRIFILGSDQNSLTEVDTGGNAVWSYDYSAPLTCIDAAAGYVVTGSLDGVLEVFNSRGERVFYFTPDGSRYSVILGCAISMDGSHIGIICGIEQQRFLLLERFGNEDDFRVIYHEYMDDSFRRPVRVLFIDGDQSIVYERVGGIGCYNLRSRRAVNIPLKGEITAVDESGYQGILFIITASAGYSEDAPEKNLVGIRFTPDRFFGLFRTDPQDMVFLKAPFKSSDIFLGRTDSILVTGGGAVLISFSMEEK